MKKNSFWFSLAEIVIWVAISWIIMVWLWVFITDSMKNINFQKKIISQDNDINIFINKLQEFFEVWNVFFQKTNSWIYIKKQNDVLWNNFLYFWIESFTWHCIDDINRSLNRIIITDKWYSWWLSSWNYTIKDNYILSWSSEKIVWWDYIWDFFSSNSKDTFLNKPSSITSSWNNLFIADSWNNRILYLSWNSLSIIFDGKKDIINPKSIYYTWGYLFVSNSWYKKAIVYDFNKKNSMSWTISFSPSSSYDINKIEYKIFSWSSLINDVFSTWSFSFSWISKNTWDTLSQSTTDIWYIYTFSWSRSLNSWNKYNISLNNLVLWNTNYFWEVKLFSWSELKEEFRDYIYDNNLKNYYLTWWEFDSVFASWSNVVFRNLVKKEDIIFSNTWSYITTQNITQNIDNFLYDIKKEKINIIIKDFIVDVSNNLFTLKIDYYTNYDCYDDTQNKVKTIIIKKDIKN